MRLAALSDIHGNLVAFEAVLKDMCEQRPDAVVFLGDLVARGPQPKECVDLLRSLKPMHIVRGNYDHLFTRFPRPDWKPQSHKDELALRAFEYDCSQLSTEDQQWLANLPMQANFEAEETRITMFHATPWSLVDITWPWAPVEELDRLDEDKSSNLVLFGHIHHSFVRQAMGRLVANTGSIGMPFDGDNRPSYLIVDIDKGNVSVQIRRVRYDIEQAIQGAKARSMPDSDAFEYALRYAEYPYNAPVAVPTK